MSTKWSSTPLYCSKNGSFDFCAVLLKNNTAALATALEATVDRAKRQQPQLDVSRRNWTWSVRCRSCSTRTWPPHPCYHSHIPTSLDMLAGVPPQPDATAWAAAAGLSRSFNLSWVLGFEDKRRSQGAAKLPRLRAKGTGARPTVEPLASDLCENMTRACVLCVIHTGKTFKTCNDLTLTVVGCSGTDIHSSRPILRVLILHP